jgi:hypothetical protein
MSQEIQSLSGAEFLKRLKSKELETPEVFEGMVKEAEEDGFFLFALGRICMGWIKVQASLVEKV